MKKAEVKKQFLRDIKCWNTLEEIAKNHADESLEKQNMIKHEREFQNECRYNAMKNAVALLGKSLELFTEEEYRKIMEEK